MSGSVAAFLHSPPHCLDFVGKEGVFGEQPRRVLCLEDPPYPWVAPGSQFEFGGNSFYWHGIVRVPEVGDTNFWEVGADSTILSMSKMVLRLNAALNKSLNGTEYGSRHR